MYSVGKNGLGEEPPEDLLTRRRLLRAGFGTAAAVAAGPLLAACGGSGKTSAGNGKGSEGGSGAGGALLEGLREKGARIGLSEFPPYALMKNGKAEGFCPEMTELVLRKLGVTKFTPVVSAFAGVIPGLQAGRIDVAAPGLTITPERCGAVLFSNPQVSFAEAFAVASGNPLKIRTYQDIAKAKARVGIVAGTVEKQLAEEGGVPASDVEEFPDPPAMVEGVKTGRVDAGGCDNVTIAYLLTLPPFKNLSETETFRVEGALYSCGTGFSKEAGELRDAFDTEQAKLFAEGGFDSIFEKWGVPKESQELAAKLTWQQLCKTA